MTNFTSKFLGQRGGGLRLVNAVEAGRECWFIVEVDPLRFPEYRQAVRSQEPDVNIHDYGTVLESGWGDNPPAERLEHWKQKAS